jgi:hypothetical protein
MTWRKRTIMEMARESGGMFSELPLMDAWVFGEKSLEAFEALVREDERNRTWTQQHWTDYERSIAAIEREACAKVVDAAKADEEDWDSNDWNQAVEFCASRIRARSNHD